MPKRPALSPAREQTVFAFDTPEADIPAAEAAAPPKCRTKTDCATADPTLPWNLIDRQGNKVGELHTKHDIARLAEILKRIQTEERGRSR